MCERSWERGQRRRAGRTMSATCGVSGGGSIRGSTACSSTVKSSLTSRSEVLGTDVVRRVEALSLHVLAVLVVEIVVNGEQQPARANRTEQPPHGGVTGGLGQRRVLHRNEVERASRGTVGALAIHAEVLTTVRLVATLRSAVGASRFVASREL